MTKNERPPKHVPSSTGAPGHCGDCLDIAACAKAGWCARDGQALWTEQRITHITRAADAVEVERPRRWIGWWQGSDERGSHVMEMREHDMGDYAREIAYLGPDHHDAVSQLVYEHNLVVERFRAALRPAASEEQVGLAKNELRMWHRDSCYPEAMDGELDAGVRRILAVVPPAAPSSGLDAAIAKVENLKQFGVLHVYSRGPTSPPGNQHRDATLDDVLDTLRALAAETRGGQ